MDLNKFRELRDRHPWTFAKTYAKKAPHHYYVKHELKSEEDQRTFMEFVVHIREYGYKKMFFKKEFTYFDLDGFQYWTYGDPLETTYILNRREKEWKQVLM